MLFLLVSAPASWALPLTVDERLAACANAEDNDPPRALALADSILAEGSRISSLHRAQAMGCRAWALAMINRSDEARRQAQELSRLAHSLPLSEQRADYLRRVGTVLHQIGDRIGAVELWAQALTEIEALGLERGRIPLLINLGVLHSELKEHERAQVNYEQALALMEQLDEMQYEAPVRFNLGLTLRGQDRHQEAIPHLQRTIELMMASGMGESQQSLTGQLALAESLAKVGETEASKALADQLREQPLVHATENLRGLLLLMDASALVDEGKPREAVEMLESIRRDELSDLMLQSVYRSLISAHRLAGNYPQAIEYQDALLERREALLLDQNHERLAAMEAQMRDREQRLDFERLQGQAEVRDLALQRTRQLQMLTLATGLLLGVLAIAIMLWQRRMNRRLDRVSRHDPLTGMANRRDMIEHLVQRMHPRHRDSSAVLLVDIDHFKGINDQYGHEFGDHVLIVLAERLNQCAVSAGGHVARWGGEEFLMLLPDCDEAASIKYAQALLTQVAAPIVYRDITLSVTVSIGWSRLPLPGSRDAKDWQLSVLVADAALYSAKADGRNAWVGYWAEASNDDWPAERLARKPDVACLQGMMRMRRSSEMSRDKLKLVR